MSASVPWLFKKEDPTAKIISITSLVADKLFEN